VGVNVAEQFPNAHGVLPRVSVPLVTTRRGAIVQCAVRLFVIVEAKIAGESRVQGVAVRILAQVEVLVLHAAP